MSAEGAMRRIAVPVDVDIPVLCRAWRSAADRVVGSPPRLGLARWAEDDDALHEQAALAWRALAAAGGLRATLLGTGSRAELLVCANPALIGARELDRVLVDIGATYRALRSDRLSRPDPDPPAPAPARVAPEAPARVAPEPTVAGGTQATPPELVVLRDGERPHLHLYYPGMAAGAAYHLLAAALPAHWTVTACDDAPEADGIEAMARSYLSILDGRYGTPDLLGGWSLGGLVGLAAVRSLAGGPAEDRPGLLLLDSPPPGTVGADSLPPDQVRAFAVFLWNSFGLRDYRPVALDMGDEDTELRLLSLALNHAGEEVPMHWLTDWLAQYRRQLRMLAGYVRGEAIDARALLFLGDLTDPEIRRWRQVVGERLLVRSLGAGHFDLLRPPMVTEVARTLSELVASGQLR